MLGVAYAAFCVAFLTVGFLVAATPWWPVVAMLLGAVGMLAPWPPRLAFWSGTAVVVLVSSMTAIGTASLIFEWVLSTPTN